MEPATLLVMFSPPHFEELLEQRTELIPEEFGDLAADYGIEPGK
ncbi:hypothetical protein [Halorubrum sp. 48-1-W]|nr:hypothetical protein [Halorubrum sp. 48-1-W]